MIALLVAAAWAAKAVVAVDDVGACEVVAADRVKVVEWPALLGVPPIADPAAVVGKVATEPLLAGEPVRAERLAADAASAGCGGAAATRVGVPTPSAAYEPGVNVAWWSPHLGCAVFAGRIVDGVDAAKTVGLGSAPAPEALSAFSRVRTTPVATPQGTPAPAVCSWGAPLPVGPWTVTSAPGAVVRGVLGDTAWVRDGRVEVPAGGVGGLVAASGPDGVRVWTVGSAPLAGAEAIVVSPGGVVVAGQDALLAGVRDRSVADVVVMPDGHVVILAVGVGTTDVFTLTESGASVRSIVVSGPPQQARPLTDRWRNLMEGDLPVVVALSGGPFETQLDHGWVQVRALAPGRAVVVFMTRSGQAHAMLVNRAL